MRARLSPRSVLALAALLTSPLLASPARATASSDELVRQARAHEAAHEDDVAVRRYMEALELDVTSEDAWLGLGALRLRLGEPAEALRVYDASLVRVPTLHRAVQGRARALWALGRHAEAEATLDTYATLEGGAGALRELGGWYGSEGRTPAHPAHRGRRGRRGARARGPPDGPRARDPRGRRRSGRLPRCPGRDEARDGRGGATRGLTRLAGDASSFAASHPAPECDNQDAALTGLSNPERDSRARSTPAYAAACARALRALYSPPTNAP